MNKYNDRFTKKLDPNTLIELLSIAKQLRDAIEKGDTEKLESLGSQKTLLLMLLEYLVLNIDNPNIDKTLIRFLELFLNIKIKKKKREEEQEEEKEEELTKSEKERRRQIIWYEVYKVLNPQRIAGETEVENFINNVRTRGIVEALKYEGAKYIKSYDKESLETLERTKASFVELLAQQGFKGGGKGLR